MSADIIETILLDFDGTLTNTEKEAEPYLIKFKEKFCELTGVKLEYLTQKYEENEEKILSNPLCGWENNGYIVAPATADPYILNRTIFQELLKDLRKEEKYNIPKNYEILNDVHHYAYDFAKTCFRPGAKKFLKKLIKKYNVIIVTNSKTGKVKNKLKELGDFNIPVVGNANKFKVFGDSIVKNLKGLNRPVLLQRKKYEKILKMFNPNKTIVIGDIYELDLALPEKLGYKTCLIKTENTPKYEIKHMNEIKNGFFAKNYDEILNKLL